jgi:transposase
VYVNLEELIPQKHILRKLDKIFNLSFVRKLTEEYYCSGNGRPSIDPELFFRMILIGYIFGIKHDRRLCEDITCNIAYRWYCKLNLDDNVPDHSSLSKIRDRYGSEVFEKFFDKVVEECRINGLVKGERIITDGSLIKADASIDSMVAKDENMAKAEVTALKERKATDRMPNRKISNETHISKSDPDSSLAKKEGTERALRYKVHSTIDANSRVILDSKITTGATHDTKVYLERIEYIKKKYKLNIKEAIADRGYGAIDNIKSLNEIVLQHISHYFQIGVVVQQKK